MLAGQQPGGARLVALALVVLFLARVSNWMGSDLWFDEVLTLELFAFQPRLGPLLTTYPAPNHHVLYSVVLWTWIRLLDPYLTEWLMRLPSTLFAAGVVALAVLHWRKWLGARPAIACGITFVASIVFASFAWQMRGFALAMLLGAIATGGAMELVEGSRRRGMMFYLPSALLLPLVLPTNVLLLAGHFAFLVLAKPSDLPWRVWSGRTLLPVATAGGLGCSYYLGIWPQIQQVWAHADGWPSAWPVAGAWATGLLAHFGPLLLLFIWQQRWLVPQLAPAATAAPRQREEVLLAWKMLAPIVALAGLFLLLQRPAPFPRIILVCLPTVTFAVFLACRASPLWSRLSLWVVGGALAVDGFAWQVATDRLTAAAVARGDRPQSLVMHYYCGQHAISQLTGSLRRSGVANAIVLVTDFHDFATTRYYWRTARLPVERVTSAWWNKPGDWQARFGPGLVLAAQARTQEQAREALRRADLLPDPPPRLTPIHTAKGLSLWTLSQEQSAQTQPADGK